MLRFLIILIFSFFSNQLQAQISKNRFEVNFSRSYHFARVTPNEDFIKYRFNRVGSLSLKYGNTFKNNFCYSIGLDLTNIQLRHSIKTDIGFIPLLEPMTLSPSLVFLIGKEFNVKSEITITPLLGFGFGINTWYLYASNNSNFEEDLHSMTFESEEDGIYMNSTANAPSPFYQRIIAGINFDLPFSSNSCLSVGPIFSFGINPIVERRFRYVNDKKGINQTIFSVSNGTLLGISCGWVWVNDKEKKRIKD